MNTFSLTKKGPPEGLRIQNTSPRTSDLVAEICKRIPHTLLRFTPGNNMGRPN